MIQEKRRVSTAWKTLLRGLEREGGKEERKEGGREGETRGFQVAKEN